MKDDLIHDAYCEEKYLSDNPSCRSEKALWKAVILQSFVDLQNESQKKIANTYRVKSLFWFNMKNEYFLRVCKYADLDPQYVYDRARELKDENPLLK